MIGTIQIILLLGLIIHLVAFFLAFLCIESGVTYLPPGVEFMPYSELKEPYFFM
jgi:hypothetical protein